MAEYIEREAFLDAIERGKKYQQDADDIAEMLQNFPAADVRPVVMGRWIDTDNYYQRWKCSVCDSHTRDARPPFCPNCGADMRPEPPKEET